MLVRNSHHIFCKPIKAVIFYSRLFVCLRLYVCECEIFFYPIENTLTVTCSYNLS